MPPSPFPCQITWYARRNVSPSPYTLREWRNGVRMCPAADSRIPMITPISAYVNSWIRTCQGRLRCGSCQRASWVGSFLLHASQTSHPNAPTVMRTSNQINHT